MHLSECQASDMEGFHEAKEDSTGEVRWEEREEFKVEKKDGDRMGCATAPVRKEEPREVEIATRVASTTCATTTAVQLSSMGTTSFTDYYTEAVRLAPADYLGRWLDYGRLRRMLARGKELREQHAATPFCDCELLPEDCVCVRPRGDQPEGLEQLLRTFFEELRTEYKHATDHFRYKREQIEQHMARARVPQLVDDSFSAAFRAVLDRMSQLTKKTACQGLSGVGMYDIVAQVYWCRTFAQLTIVAMNKLIDRVRKDCGSEDGTAVLRGLVEWSRSVGGMHCNPWVIELCAIDELSHMSRAASKRRFTLFRQVSNTVQHYAADRRRVSKDVDGGPAGASPPMEDHGFAMSPPTREFGELNVLPPPNMALDMGQLQLKFESVDDVCCAVCLEVMYMPVGLKCGHLFCMSCIKQAVGVESSKPLRSAPMKACCPSCRQRGVFAGAVELYELNNLIRRKFTRQWLEQRKQATDDHCAHLGVHRRRRTSGSHYVLSNLYNVPVV